MNRFIFFFKKQKLQKELKKHDKSYINKKHILGYDENTNLPIYSYDLFEEIKKNQKSVDKFILVCYNVFIERR